MKRSICTALLGSTGLLLWQSSALAGDSTAASVASEAANAAVVAVNPNVLDAAARVERTGLAPQASATIYTNNSSATEALSGDANDSLNRIALQALDAAQKQSPGSFDLAANTIMVAATATAQMPPQMAPETVVITARLNEARALIEPQIGASTYTITSAAIDATPAGSNTLLNQVILQAPDVAQDSFGQLHIRGDHNGLQYRLNGIILPEGINVFSQSFSSYFISSMQLITGTLPAEYGLRTAGIIDLTTKSGQLAPGGSVSIYGGSHGTVQPSFQYAGAIGNFSYFLSGDFLRNDVGIESPDGRGTPIHDTTNQYHGFGYFEYLLSPQNRVSLILGGSDARFQIPNRSGEQPSDVYGGGNGLGPGGALVVNGQTLFPSENLNERQREISDYAIASFQHSEDTFDVQTSLISRRSSLGFSPDILGDLLYNGVAQQAYKQNVSYGWQTDSAFRLIDNHTLRAGYYIETDRGISNTASQVLPTDPITGIQTTDVPITIVDNGGKTQWIESVYLQDEWKLLPMLTLNYGLRFDNLTSFASGNQLSPRANVVWQATDTTTVHAGYSRYFSPPPFELVGTETVSKFLNTTNQPSVTQDDPVQAERSNYFDVGAQQKLFDHLTLGVDTFWKVARNLIDEGQFGAPIILTPFNYKYGKIYGAEFTANYVDDDFSAYANLALQHAQGKDFESSQFNFSQDDLDYVSTHYIDLDHEQHLSISAGASYMWQGTRFMADMLVGSGLRSTPPGGPPNGAHLPYYTQVNVGVSHDFDIRGAGDLTVRFDVINLFDETYAIRNGTGVGVGAPQFGPRRGFFAGISKSI